MDGYLIISSRNTMIWDRCLTLSLIIILGQRFHLVSELQNQNNFKVFRSRRGFNFNPGRPLFLFCFSYLSVVATGEQRGGETLAALHVLLLVLLGVVLVLLADVNVELSLSFVVIHLSPLPS